MQKTSRIDFPDSTPNTTVPDEPVADVQAVLYSLGYSPEEAKKAIRRAYASAEKKESPKEVLKGALRYRAQGE